jgi:hypothetical protein
VQQLLQRELQALPLAPPLLLLSAQGQLLASQPLSHMMSPDALTLTTAPLLCCPCCPAAGASPIKTVLRSKGFMWIANSHTTAFYWSHAGQHFEIRDEGEW